MRDENESLLSGIIARLINVTTGQTIDKTVTNQQGQYKFNNLEAGKYVVEFDYNLLKYVATDSNKDGIADNVNSDAITVTENKIVKTKTEVIEVKDSDVKYIDIGLKMNEIFDLKIEKFVNKITVKNSAGITEYSYTADTDTAKIEIPSKYIANSTLIVEYNIKITNTGALPGYAKIVSDTKPTGMVFKSELNEVWYEGTDGKLYLADNTETLESGETKIVKLVLTKDLTTDEAQIVTNKADIEETFTEYIVDEKTTKDNTSDATVVVGIKTGKETTVILILVIDLVVIACGCVFIKRKVIVEK